MSPIWSGRDRRGHRCWRRQGCLFVVDDGMRAAAAAAGGVSGEHEQQPQQVAVLTKGWSMALASSAERPRQDEPLTLSRKFVSMEGAEGKIYRERRGARMLRFF